MTVIGYSDSRGNREANLVLSHRRADAVSALLRHYGVSVESSKGAGIAPDLTFDYGRDRLVLVKVVAGPQQSQ